MKFEFPSVTYYPHPTNQFNESAVLKFIEKIGRTCYRSEAAITDESARKFVDMIIHRGHTSVLEHYHFIWEGSDYLFNLLARYKYVEYWKVETDKWLFSANAVGLGNALVKCREELLENEDPDELKLRTIESMIWRMKVHLPTLFQNLPDVDEKSKEVWKWSTHYHFLTPGEYASVPFSAKNINWATFRFVTNRGVSHEIVRHRPASYSQESTRYCNYSKNKFGSELEFIVPQFEVDENFLQTLQLQEKTYMDMLQAGHTPQEARSVLSNQLSTRIVMSAHIDEWEHFLKMRTALDAHPDMIIVANLVRQIFNKDLIYGDEPYYVGNPGLPPKDSEGWHYVDDPKQTTISIMEDPNRFTE